MIPRDFFYTKEHEWCRFENNHVIAGITDHAQKELGDVVFVELPETGRTVNKGESIAVVESVKAVSDVYSPVSGVITSVNKALEKEPQLINDDPYGEGWMVKIEVSNPNSREGLLSPEEYERYLRGDQ